MANWLRQAPMQNSSAGQMRPQTLANGFASLMMRMALLRSPTWIRRMNALTSTPLGQPLLHGASRQ